METLFVLNNYSFVSLLKIKFLAAIKENYQGTIANRYHKV
jgi:hypothetical protein